MRSFIEFVFNEISKNDIDDVYSHIGEVSPSQLPFNNIFGNNYCIVIPFKEDQSGELKKRIESKGYRVDLNKGLAYKKVKTQQGEKEVAVRIGKILTPEEQNLWSKVANLSDVAKKRDSDEYSVIISRHPIDVLRMSDWRHLHSCHASDDSYFHCAISEAKNGGLIAYLVHNSAIKSATDLQNEELFSDRERHISGITPEGRLRVRRFTNGKIDLAIPELRTYGGSGNTLFDKFKSVVNDFFRNKQSNITKDRLRAKDFKLHGGTYQDNPPGELFNNFFKDKVDFHNDSGGHVAGEEDIAEQRKREIAAIDKAKNKFENHIGCWYMENDEWNNVNDMFYFDGSIRFYFPDEQWAKRDMDWKFRNTIITQLGRLKEMPSNIEELEFNEVDENGELMEVRFSSEIGGPDDYSNYLDNLKRLDNHYLETRKSVEEILIDAGVLYPSKFNQKVNDIQWDSLQFFELVDYDWEEQGIITLESLEIEVHPSTNIDISPLINTDKQNIVVNIKNKTKNIVDNYLKNVMHMKIRQKILPFRDFMQVKNNTDDFSVETQINFDARFRGRDRGNYLKILLRVQPDKHTPEALQHTYNKVKILDNHFVHLTKLIQKMV